MRSSSSDKVELDEKQKSAEQHERFPVSVTIKLDGTGLPLIPQPNASETDPLNYPNWLKWLILSQVSVLAFLATLNVAIINPAVVPLASEFNIPHVTATYQTTVAIGTSALGPLVFVPIANIYGRRPVYLFTLLIGFASAIGSAEAKSYGTLILARAFNGSGAATAAVLGAGTISDMCYIHQRGKAMGLYTVMLTNGAHLAPIIGGYVARSHGWRWCFWVGAMLNGALLVICLFLLPETLYSRPPGSYDEVLADLVKNDDLDSTDIKELLKQGEVYHPPPLRFWTYVRRLGLWYTSIGRQLRGSDFIIKPLSMLRYPSVAFPALFYGVVYGFASIEPALTLATLFTRIYHFDTVQNGLANGISLLVGASLGELCSGPVTDIMMQRARRRALEQGKTAAVEVRLHGIWTGAITVPVGLLMYDPVGICVIIIPRCDGLTRGSPDGFTIRYAHTFVAPCIGMAVACFGMQIVSSVCYTYSCNDCYNARSNDASICFGFIRQVFGLTLGFYSIPFGDEIGYQWSFTVFAAICVITFVPIILLMFKGEEWRIKLGAPPTD